MRLFLRLLLLVALLGAASGPALAAGRTGPVVLAAASLQEALTAAADAWAAGGHSRPVLSFAASPALARQIEAGAPADLFISADEAWMDHLAGKGLIHPKTRTSFLANRLVLVESKSRRTSLDMRPGFPLARTLGSGRLAMADPDAVPAGRYGKAALVRLGVWKDVQAKIAAAENVRAALALVERGAAPLGIVYLTDAKAAKGVRIVAAFPGETHPPITYPLARLRASTHAEADAFRQFLLSPQAQAIFHRYGFRTGRPHADA